MNRMKVHVPYDDVDHDYGVLNILCSAPDCGFGVEVGEGGTLPARQMFVDHQTGEKYLTKEELV